MTKLNRPHTVVTYKRNGRVETWSRPGHLMPSGVGKQAGVEQVLKPRGVRGAIVVRHHAAGGGLVAIFPHVIQG